MYSSQQVTTHILRKNGTDRERIYSPIGGAAVEAERVRGLRPSEVEGTVRFGLPAHGRPRARRGPRPGRPGSHLAVVEAPAQDRERRGLYATHGVPPAREPLAAHEGEGITTEAVPERAGNKPDTELRLAVHAALLSLPATQRAAIVLRYFEDHTEASAAAILDCPVTTLRARVQRGLRRFQERA